MSTAISYIRNTITKSPTSPVVLMGFSTGCQDLMHYLVSPISPSKPSRASISGIILQAPVSDREAILHEVATDPATKSAYEEALAIASSTPKDKHKSTILPLDLMTHMFGPAPVTISRFLSLASPESPENPGMDDYYSSDLFDDRLRSTFGHIGSVEHLLPSSATKQKSILILQGSVDKSIPPTVDKHGLLSRWKSFLTKGNVQLDPNSQIIEHANHEHSGTTFEKREARLVTLRGAVLHYLDAMVGGVGAGAHGIWERDRDELKGEAYTKKLGEVTKSVDEAKL